MISFWPFNPEDREFDEFRKLWTREQRDALALHHILTNVPIRELAMLWVAQHKVFATAFDGGKRVAAITTIIQQVDEEVLAMKIERNYTAHI